MSLYPKPQGESSNVFNENDYGNTTSNNNDVDLNEFKYSTLRFTNNSVQTTAFTLQDKNKINDLETDVSYNTLNLTNIEFVNNYSQIDKIKTNELQLLGEICVPFTNTEKTKIYESDGRILTNTNDINIINEIVLIDIESRLSQTESITSSFTSTSTTVSTTKALLIGSAGKLQDIAGSFYIYSVNAKNMVLHTGINNLIAWTPKMYVGNSDGGKVIISGNSGSLTLRGEVQENAFTNADHTKLNNIDTNKIDWISSVNTTNKQINTEYDIKFNNNSTIGINSNGLLINSPTGITLNNETLIVTSNVISFEASNGSGIYLSPGTFWNFDGVNQTRAYSEANHNMNINNANEITKLNSRIHIDSYRPNDWTNFGRPGTSPFLHSTSYADTILYNIFNQAEFNAVGLGIIQNGSWVGGNKRLLVKYSSNLAVNGSQLLICKSRFRLNHNSYLEGNNVFQGVQYNTPNTVTNIVQYEVSQVINVSNGDILYLETNFNMTMASSTTFYNWCSYHLTEL
jgi:hypothetical protein